MRKLGIIIGFLIFGIIFLYWMFLSPAPLWLEVAYNITSLLIGSLLLFGFGYWIYSGVRKLVHR